MIIYGATKESTKKRLDGTDLNTTVSSKISTRKARFTGLSMMLSIYSAHTLDKSWVGFSSSILKFSPNDVCI